MQVVKLKDLMRAAGQEMVDHYKSIGESITAEPGGDPISIDLEAITASVLAIGKWPVPEIVCSECDGRPRYAVCWGELTLCVVCVSKAQKALAAL